MPDRSEDNHADENLPVIPRHRKDADKGREPQLVPAQFGSRWVSQAALIEQIESAFWDEHRDGSPALQEADTTAKRLKLLLETANYVFAVESVQLNEQGRAAVISQTYSNLFGYGPLDALFLDDRVTTISLEGVDKASVRYGHDELTSLGPIFQNADHFQRIVRRLLHDAGTELRPDQPYVEVGLMAGNRPICINLMAPPVTIQLTADIRVHPQLSPAWDTLIASDFMTEQASKMLKALVASSHGLLLIGEPESGKTTLLNLLANMLPSPDQTIAVERAGEMRLPAAMRRLTVKWPVGERVGVSFGEQITHALAQNPACILLDEVRADEPHSIAPLLQRADAPRQIWSFRGAIFAKRLQNALGMLARRAEVGGGEALVRVLYERLPFVIAVNRVGGQLRLWSIGEWQFKHSPDYPTYTTLMQVQDGRLQLTGDRPAKPLNWE